MAVPWEPSSKTIKGLRGFASQFGPGSQSLPSSSPRSANHFAPKCFADHHLKLQSATKHELPMKSQNVILQPWPPESLQAILHGTNNCKAKITTALKRTYLLAQKHRISTRQPRVQLFEGIVQTLNHTQFKQCLSLASRISSSEEQLLLFRVPRQNTIGAMAQANLFFVQANIQVSQ